MCQPAKAEKNEHLEANAKAKARATECAVAIMQMQIKRISRFENRDSRVSDSFHADSIKLTQFEYWMNRTILN